MRRATLLLAVVAIALSLTVEPFRDGVDWLPDLLTGWALAACGVAAARSHVGPLLAASGVLWFLGWPGALAYRAPLALAVLTPRRRRPPPAIVAMSIALAVAPLAQNLPVALALAAATVLAGARSRDALGGAAVLGATVAGGAIVTHALPGAATVAITTAYGAGIVVASAMTVSAVLRAEWEPVELADAFAASDTVEAFRDALADAVADTTLTVAFLEERAVAAADGAGTTTGRQFTTILAGGEPVALLEHRAGALDDRALFDAISAATRLQAANVHLQRDLAAQADALVASGLRLLAAGDEQRRRLERRVRDGPLAGLHALDERLAALDSPELARARADLAASQEDLQTLAFGLHPGTDIGAAVATLAARSPVPAKVTADGLPELPGAVRSALLFTCGEALANVAKHAEATRVEIVLSFAHGNVALTVADDGRGGADPAAGSGLLGLRDRIELLGGTLHVGPGDGGGTRLIATVPAEAAA